MKRSALIKILAVALVVFGISMLVAGLLGIRGAGKEKDKADAEIAKLNETIDRYRTVTNRLIDSEGYSSTNDAYQEQKDAYEEALEKQRSDLAVYSATKGGLATGTDAIDSADEALKQGKAQYEAGLRAFEDQEAQFLLLYESALAAKTELEEGKALLGEAVTVLSTLKQAANSLRSLDTLMDLNADDVPESSPTLYQSVLAAYDTAIAAVETAEGAVWMVTDRDIPISTVRQALEAASVSLSLPLDDNYVVIFPSAGVARLEQATGVSLAGILADLEAEKAALEAGGSESILTPEQFETIRNAYTNNRNAIAGSAGQMLSIVDELDKTVAEARAQIASAEAGYQQLDAAKAAIDEGRTKLEEAGKQIAAGVKALEEGRSKLVEEQNKLDDKGTELETERDRLAHEQEALSSLEEKTEELKLLEEQESALRASLLGRDGIAAKNNDGLELLRAAEDYISAYRRESKEDYQMRFAACFLQILGCLTAVVLIPAVFGRKDHPGLLLVAALFCIGFSAAAQVLFFRLGRGVSYSALLSCSFGRLLATVSLLPVGKKTKAGRHAAAGK